MKFPIPARFSRSFPAVAVTLLFLFLLTATRFDRDPRLPGNPESTAPATTSTQSLPEPGDRNGQSKPHAESPLPNDWQEIASPECLPEINFLRRKELSLTEEIVYSRRCVVPTGTLKAEARDTIANSSKPLIAEKMTLNLSSCAHDHSIPCDPLMLDVPSAYPAQSYPQMVFGVASKYERMNESLPAFAHWLAGTNALLVAVIADANDKEHKISDLENAYRARGISAKFIAAEKNLKMEAYHFTLIRDLLRNAPPQAEWLSVLDDDTFFPSLYPVNEELRKYDASKPYWLGAVSDDWESVKVWGFMAFGGAGTFLSVPLARQLEPHLETCLEETQLGTGDGMLAECVYGYTRTKLTLVYGMYQHDIQGDASGFYEGGLRPLSVHHWKSWYHEPMDKMAAVTRVCGDCFLQRFKFGSDTLFTNGYSITQYPGKSGRGNGLDDINLSRIEGTWDNIGTAYRYSYGQLREKLGNDMKKSYKLVDSIATDQGEFRQIYVYKGSVEQRGAKDEVVDLLWTKQQRQ